MSDIRFGAKWARADYGLIVAPYAIPMPEPQTSFVDIPGRDGALDLSETLGTVRYADRIIPLTFYVRAPVDAAVSTFAADVHGRRLNVIFDRDPMYYHDARITIEDVEKHAGYCELSLECRARPYKLEHYETTVTAQVEGTGRVTLANTRMPVVPVITTSAEMTLTYAIGGADYSIPQTYPPGNRTHTAGQAPATSPDEVLRKPAKCRKSERGVVQSDAPLIFCVRKIRLDTAGVGG